MGMEISETGRQGWSVKWGENRDKQRSVRDGMEIEWGQIGGGIVEKGWSRMDFVGDPLEIWYLALAQSGQCMGDSVHYWGARQDCNGQEWAGKGWAGCTRVVMPLLCLSLGAQGQALVLQGIRCCWVFVCCSVGVIQWNSEAVVMCVWWVEMQTVMQLHGIVQLP